MVSQSLNRRLGGGGGGDMRPSVQIITLYEFAMTKVR